MAGKGTAPPRLGSGGLAGGGGGRGREQEAWPRLGLEPASQPPVLCSSAQPSPHQDPWGPRCSSEDGPQTPREVRLLLPACASCQACLSGRPFPAPSPGAPPGPQETAGANIPPRLAQ